MVEPKICRDCKFFVAEPSSAGKNVDYSTYVCTHTLPPVICYDNRRTEGACGPEGKFWEHK